MFSLHPLRRPERASISIETRFNDEPFWARRFRSALRKTAVVPVSRVLGHSGLPQFDDHQRKAPDEGDQIRPAASLLRQRKESEHQPLRAVVQSSAQWEVKVSAGLRCRLPDGGRET